MRRFLNAFSRYRPRVLTILLVAAIGALIVLANLSDEVRARIGPPPPPNGLAFDAREATNDDYDLWNVSYGWPLLWRQQVITISFFGGVTGECHSAGRLAANVAMWLAMLGLPAAICEWLLRRYRIGLRWSLRTMLAAVGLIAAGCGWFIAARNQANSGAALVADIESAGNVWLERRGPDWLELIGAGSWRQRIVGAELPQFDHENERLVTRLARLPSLRYLSLTVDRWTPQIADALGEMRALQTLDLKVVDRSPDLGHAVVDALVNNDRLRVLSIDLNPWSDTSPQPGEREFLKVIGNLTQLESLAVYCTSPASENLEGLGRLKNLKTLTLGIVRRNRDDANLGRPLLSRLPALPRLESLLVGSSDVGDRDIQYLARLPSLRSLDLVRTDITGAGLASLASLKSLRELAIGSITDWAMSLRSLCGLKDLRLLHINGLSVLFSTDDATDRDCRRALEALRRSNPSLVIDDDIASVGRSGEAAPPWKDDDWNREVVRRAHLVLRQWAKASKARRDVRRLKRPTADDGAASLHRRCHHRHVQTQIASLGEVGELFRKRPLWRLRQTG